MSKKIIAIDLDDVVADSTEALRLEANKLPGVNLTREHYQIEGEYWAYYEAVWAANKVDHLVSFDKLQSDMAASQSHVGLIKGAKEALQKLSKKYRIILVTSREVNWIEATNRWVEDNLGSLVERVVFVHHKNSDGRTKGDACNEIGAEWLIDDNIQHCESALEKGVKVLLFGNYGWNRRAIFLDNLNPRTKNWSEVLEYFDGRG